MAAEILAKGGVEVTILDHMPAPARKFLRGRGGLNLTFRNDWNFFTRYGAGKGFSEKLIALSPQALIEGARPWH